MAIHKVEVIDVYPRGNINEAKIATPGDAVSVRVGGGYMDI